MSASNNSIPESNFVQYRPAVNGHWEESTNSTGGSKGPADSTQEIQPAGLKKSSKFDLNKLDLNKLSNPFSGLGKRLRHGKSPSVQVLETGNGASVLPQNPQHLDDISRQQQQQQQQQQHPHRPEDYDLANQHNSHIVEAPVGGSNEAELFPGYGDEKPPLAQSPATSRQPVSRFDPGPSDYFRQKYNTGNVTNPRLGPLSPVEAPGSSPGSLGPPPTDLPPAELSAIKQADPPAELQADLAHGKSPAVDQFSPSTRDSQGADPMNSKAFALAGASGAWATRAPSNEIPNPPLSSAHRPPPPPPKTSLHESSTPRVRSPEGSYANAPHSSPAYASTTMMATPTLPQSRSPGKRLSRAQSSSLQEPLASPSGRNIFHDARTLPNPGNPFEPNSSTLHLEGDTGSDEEEREQREQSEEPHGRDLRIAQSRSNTATPPSHLSAAAQNHASATFTETSLSSQSKKPSLLNKAFGRGEAEADPTAPLQKRAKAFVTSFDKNKKIDIGQDWFSTLISWAGTELERRDSAAAVAASDRDDWKRKFEQTSSILAQREDEIRKLSNARNERDQYKSEWQIQSRVTAIQAKDLNALNAKVQKLQEASKRNKELTDELRAGRADLALLERERNYYLLERDKAKTACETAQSQLWNEKKQHKDDLERAQQENEKERQKLRTDLENAHRIRVSDLESAHKDRVSELEHKHRHVLYNLDVERTRTESELRQQIENHRIAYANQQQMYQSQLQTHQSELQTERDKAQVAEADLRSQLNTIAEQTMAKSAAEIVGLKAEKDALKKQIAEHSSTGDYEPLEDKHFKQSFRALCQMINNLVPKTHRPPGHAMSPAVDPTGFLARHPESRHWGKFVRHTTWMTIVVGFFSYPSGLGALGSEGPGYSELAHFYSLFSRPNPNGELTLFL